MIAGTAARQRSPSAVFGSASDACANAVQCASSAGQVRSVRSVVIAGSYSPRRAGRLRRSVHSAMDIDPALLPPSERYKLLIGGIIPRPIALVSSISPDGRVNLAPFSFFNGVGSDPMTLLFCPANKPDGSDKDTLKNVLSPTEGGTGEFVVNTVSESFARQMAACAEPMPHGESEFDLSGLTPAPSVRVRPPRVAESPLSFECITDRVIRLNPGVPAGGNIVIGRVVHVHARDGLINERRHVDPAAMQAIGRMGGLGYCRTRERFEMPMGRPALDLPDPF
jgi:flavin reductase (DIM6/NTAB) family NADH-FMN oxidoreductase RutF